MRRASPPGDDTTFGAKRNVHPAHHTAQHLQILATAGLVLAVLATSGCSTSRDRLTTGSIPKMNKAVASMSEPELARAPKAWGQAYDRNPKDRNIGLSYANVLMMQGRNAQALAVMQQVAIANPTDREVLAALGKAQAAAGQLEKALGTINRAQTPDRPDWRLYSAEGAVLDQLGRSDEARGRYRMALQIQPNDPSVLSNLGMSYVLTGDLKTAKAISGRPRSNRGRQPRSAEPGAGDRLAGTVPGGRADRGAGTQSAAGGGEPAISARHALAAEFLAAARVAGQTEEEGLRSLPYQINRRSRDRGNAGVIGRWSGLGRGVASWFRRHASA